MTQYKVVFDGALCVGCGTCQIACMDKNRLGPGEALRRVHMEERGEFPAPAVSFSSQSCLHCKNPACAAVCPTGRIRRDEDTGVVYAEPKASCTGCMKCRAACPQHHPVYAKAQGKVVKCDLCMDLIMGGAQPACVSACMMRALRVEKI